MCTYLSCLIKIIFRGNGPFVCTYDNESIKNKKQNRATSMFSLRETAMRLRNQRPLQGNAGHPG
jgi:hypothetical protein